MVCQHPRDREQGTFLECAVCYAQIEPDIVPRLDRIEPCRNFCA
jgi:hypothetical protein